MPLPRYRLFFDTSVYIAALISPQGAAGELLRLVETGAITMVVSEEVIRESDRVLGTKLPELVQESRRLWKHLAPEVFPNPTPDALKSFLEKLPKGDAKILCAAHLAKVTAFVTWNTRDFMASSISKLVDFPILIPADGLKLFRKWIGSSAY